MKKFLTVFAAVLLFPVSGSAGWYVETASTGGETRKTYIEGASLAELSDNEMTITDMSTRSVTFVNHKTKTAAVMSMDEMKAFAKEREKMLEDSMTEAMKQMTPEQQAAYKKMTGSQDAKKNAIKVQKSGNDKIAGFSSAKYQVISDGKVIEEIWISSEVPFYEEFKKNSDAIIEDSSSFGLKDYTSDKAYIDVLKSGYPLKQRILNDSIMQGIPSEASEINWSTDEVKLVQKMDVSQFMKIPAAYKKTGFKEYMMQNADSSEQ